MTTSSSSFVPTKDVASHLVQGLVDPATRMGTMEQMLGIGLHAFDTFAMVVDGSRPVEVNHFSIWDIVARSKDPLVGLQRLSAHVNELWSKAPEQGSSIALNRWFSDAWCIKDLIESGHPQTLIVDVLRLAMASVRATFGGLSDDVMTQFPQLLAPVPKGRSLPEEWTSPVGRALVQGLMHHVSCTVNGQHAIQLMDASLIAGVPLDAWACRFQRINPQDPNLGMARIDEPFPCHLGRMTRWGVVRWWVDHTKSKSSPWGMERASREDWPSDEVTSLLYHAWLQTLSSDTVGDSVYTESRRDEDRANVLNQILSAALDGDQRAQQELENSGLLNDMKRVLLGRQGLLTPTLDRMLSACLTYEEQRLHEVLPPTSTVPESPMRRRL